MKRRIYSSSVMGSTGMGAYLERIVLGKFSEEDVADFLENRDLEHEYNLQLEDGVPIEEIAGDFLNEVDLVARKSFQTSVSPATRRNLRNTFIRMMGY